MKNKRNILIIVGLIFIITIVTIILIPKEKNLIKLSYKEIIEKVDNKDDFILCISRTNCVHCQEYKPKLKKLAKDYNIIIYYTNTDDFTKEEYETFKKDFSFDGGTPTTIFFKNGEEKTTATRINGNVKTDKIISKLKNNGFIPE